MNTKVKRIYLSLTTDIFLPARLKNIHEICGLARLFHEMEAFTCKAFKGAAIVDYCKPLITPQVEASGSPKG